MRKNRAQVSSDFNFWFLFFGKSHSVHGQRTGTLTFIKTTTLIINHFKHVTFQRGFGVLAMTYLPCVVEVSVGINDDTYEGLNTIACFNSAI